MHNWIDAVEVELQKVSHEDQTDEYESGYACGIGLGLDTIKANSSVGAAKLGVQSEHTLFEQGYKSEPTEFSRGMRDGLKRVLELA